MGVRRHALPERDPRHVHPYGRADEAGRRALRHRDAGRGHLDGIPREIALWRLDGLQLARFTAAAAADFVERGVAFDGARISWSTGFVVVANAALADLEPKATKPSVRIVSPHGNKRARGVLFIQGTARDPDGRVAEVRVGITRVSDCRAITRLGRLGPSRFPNGRCRAKAKFVAQGGEAWTYPLKRKLPRGRYVVRAVVRDDAGQKGATSDGSASAADVHRLPFARVTQLRPVRLVLLLAFAGGLALLDPQLVGIFAPALALFGLLVIDVRPGEHLIVRLLRARIKPRRSPTTLPSPALPIVVRQAGRLIAAALAVRPPPARAAVSA